MSQARELAHPFSLAYALTWAAMLHGSMSEFDSLVASAEAVLTLERQHSLLWSSWARSSRGGRSPKRGLELGYRRAPARRRANARDRRPLSPAFVSLQLADLLAKLGRVQHGLELVNEALASTCNDPYWCDAELERLAGELLLTQGVDVQQAEAAYQRAIQIAQAHDAKPFELRARTSWARLLSKQGSSAKARQVLAGTYRLVHRRARHARLEECASVTRVPLVVPLRWSPAARERRRGRVQRVCKERLPSLPA